MRGFHLVLRVLPALLLAPGSAPAQVVTQDYRLGPLDIIEVNVLEVPALESIELQVSQAGTILLPVIGEVAVQGLTAEEAASRLRQVLEKRGVRRATVDVQVRKFVSKPISVIGAVKNPGPLRISGRWTLLEALTSAGGLTADHGKWIYVSRRAENNLSDQLAIRVDDLMLDPDPRANIPVFSNDLINVPQETPITVYCLGEVTRPSGMEFRSSDRITLLTAVARAGGLTERASRKILIKRRTTSGDETEIVANYRKIIAGRQPDIELLEGDVIYVKRSLL